MGMKKRRFFSAVKKVLNIESKRSENSKKKNETLETVATVPPTPPKESENDHSMHAYSVAIATAAAAEAAAAAARAAAAEVARLTAVVSQSDELKGENAAIKIQIAYRGHLEKRKLRALRGSAGLKSMIQGRSVQRQSIIALQCMQTLSRVQSQVQSSRVKMSDVNLALQQQLQHKREKEFDKLRSEQLLQQKCEKDFDKLKPPSTVSRDWNSSAASKEEMEAKLQYKEEAAEKRQRALAYAYSHKRVRKNTSKPENPENLTFTGQADPFKGWSWLATRPSEDKNSQDRHVIADQDNTSLKSNPTPTPKPKLPLPTPPPKARSTCPKMTPTGSKSGPSSVKSEANHRHTIAGLSVGKDDKKVISKTVSTASVPSRLGNGKLNKGSFGSDKKQLFTQTSSPGMRRHSLEG